MPLIQLLSRAHESLHVGLSHFFKESALGLAGVDQAALMPPVTFELPLKCRNCRQGPAVRSLTGLP
jgi:hypothetical protein